MSTTLPDHRPPDPSPRPHLFERAEYKPRHNVERFIVPVLSDWLNSTISELVPRGGRVIDVGCGRQPLRKLVESCGAKYLSMDVVQNQEHSVDFVLPIDGPLPDAMFAEGHFDLVLCTEVLEHVADWSAAFENLIRLCVVGGRVILTCPQFYPPHEEPYDFWRPTPNAITWHARRAGFEVEKLERGGDLWGVLGTILGGHTVASVSHRLRSRIIGRLVRVAFRLAFWALESGWLQSHCRAIPITLGSFHLSNLAVLRKP